MGVWGYYDCDSDDIYDAYYNLLDNLHCNYDNISKHDHNTLSKLIDQKTLYKYLDNIYNQDIAFGLLLLYIEQITDTPIKQIKNIDFLLPELKSLGLQLLNLIAECDDNQWKKPNDRKKAIKHMKNLFTN